MHITELLGNRVITLDAITLSMEEIKFQNNLSIWPNPFKNELNIKGLKIETSYSIVNMNGVEVQSGTIINKIHTQNLSPGIYMLEIDTINKTYYKLIKK